MMDWSPFILASGKYAPDGRSLQTPEGVGDRLRSAAFAELQAVRGFRWAAAQGFGDATRELEAVWLALALEEEKHLGWLLGRMADLQQTAGGRPVSDVLWRSYMLCVTAEQFVRFMGSAEERGRIAGERFYELLKPIDLVSAEIFRQIAIEEAEHVRLAQSVFRVEASLTHAETK